MFYKENTLKERFKSVHISAILTPLNKTFALLCIKVYFNSYTNLKLEGYDPSIEYISKVGWKGEGIELYNILYHRVVRNCESYNEQFDVTFAEFVSSLLDSGSNKRH